MSLLETTLRALPARKAYREIVNAIIRHDREGSEDPSEKRRDFHRAAAFHAEVLNGGFEQYFTNSSGKEYRLTLASLAAVGATAQRDLLLRSVDLLSPYVDLTDRHQVGEYLFGTSQARDAFGALDEQYYASLESFYKAMTEFALANAPAFQIIPRRD
jgi:hypothetical protein